MDEQDLLEKTAAFTRIHLLKNVNGASICAHCILLTGIIYNTAGIHLAIH